VRTTCPARRAAAAATSTLENLQDSDANSLLPERLADRRAALTGLRGVAALPRGRLGVRRRYDSLTSTDA